MASFDNVANSVRAAADIQRRFAVYNADASETLSVRIGIDAGEPVEDHNDLFGSTVQLAARLCSEAEANGIIVSGFAASCARRRMRGGSCRSASGGSRVLPIRLRCSDLSGGTQSPIASNDAQFLDHGGCRSNKGGTTMPAHPDPTFHASAKLAMQAPPEKLAYAVMLSSDSRSPTRLQSSTSIPARSRWAKSFTQ